jgi:methyl-accepting chemotaxis protein
LEELRHRIRSLRGAVEMRLPGQHEEPVRTLQGPLGLLIETLNLRWAEEKRVEDEGREDALGLRHELTLALVDARDSAELAERGFVEATALLTTVRELQRLGGELKQGLSTAPEAPAVPAPPLAESQHRYREVAAAAIEELVSASNESVERLATGLVRVQEIGEQVQVLANRATLIALHVALSDSGDSGPRPEGLSHDLRSLAGEVRAVTDLTAERFTAIDREVEAAVERMKGLRERVAAKLNEAPPIPEAAAAAPSAAQPTEAALRLLERVREMVQDAAAKGERLSAGGERASRAAERLVRRLEEETGTLEGLALRLGATAEELREGGADPGAITPSSADESRPGDLRLLGPDHAKPRAAEPAPGDEDAEERR